LEKNTYGTNRGITMAGDERSMSRFDALLWDLAEAGDLPTLPEVVRSSLGKPQEHIVFETVIVEAANPIEAIRPTKGALAQACTIKTVGSVSVMRVDHEHGPFTMSAWPTAYDGVFHLVGGVPAADRRWTTAERWINNAAPRTVRCFLDHDDFTDIGTALSEHAEVEVQRLTGRMRVGHSSYGRSFRALAGDALRPDHIDIIAESEQHGAAVRSMHLHVGDVVDVAIRRQAGATFVHGDFDVFEATVLNRLALAAHNRRVLMSNRERVVNEPPKRPIQIRLAADTFTDARTTGQVLDELDVAANHVTYAVMHRNPYLHVALTDETDGSNYDLFITRPDTIELHPGYRASLGSLTRLSQVLGDRFEALTLREEPAPEPVSFYDLVDSFAD
jgi:hypothetical protein